MAFEQVRHVRGAGFLLAALTVPGACGGDGAAAGVDGNAGAGGNAGGGSAGAGGNVGGGGSAGAGGRAGASGNADGGGSAAGSGGGVASGKGGSATGAAAGGGGAAGAPPMLQGSGKISYERWEGVKGEAVELVPVNEKPTVALELAALQMPDDVGQDFGARLRGFLTAPVTGDYVFWLSCDDNGELSLSSDESPTGKQRIAYVSGSPAWTDYVEWNKFPTQKSATVSLVAGKRYYVEALLKEDVAEDHLAVGWLKPGEVGTLPSEIIPGEQLSPFPPVP